MRKNKLHSGLLLILGILIQFMSGCISDEKKDGLSDKIWYTHPAEAWEEALPLGNGRLGAMVYGGTSTERIQLNDDSLWPGEAGWDDSAGNPDDLHKIRKMLIEGNIAGADRLWVEKFSRKRVTRSHQTLGELTIKLDHEEISEYRRELNLSEATATISYRSDGSLVTEKVFATYPGRAIMIEISTQAEQGLNGKVYLGRPEDEGHPTVSVSTSPDRLLVMSGEVTQYGGIFDHIPVPVTEGVRFETCLKIRNTGGEIIATGDHLEMKNVNTATFYIVSNSSFYNEDFSRQNLEDLASIGEMDFEAIRQEHVRDFQSLYSRVELSLTDECLDTIPTDRRLERIADGETDPELVALLFQYGRYLLISCSRPGTLPANLQGLWNQHITAPWNADYHLNINLQMNYWPADLTALGELNGPLFDYTDRLIESGHTTAMRNFGCRGSFIPHGTDLWVPTWTRGWQANWCGYSGAGGWLVQHYWRHFEFTLDTVFLRERAYPALLETARFYSDWIIEDPRDGKLVSAPSVSPENRYYDPDSNVVSFCMGSAMDQQIIAEVFDHFIRACDILEITDSFQDTIKKQRSQLREGLIIGSDGRILEWDREYPEFDPGHRHMSHLYAFHPGTSITRNRTPELFNAVRTSLEDRLAKGGAQTGWSKACLINFSARLLDGEMAHEHIQLFLQNSLYGNLFNRRPFQIDGNFGFTSGIAEMLLQSHEGDTIRVLPALPRIWKNGYVRGLKARGGLTCDIYWEDGRLAKAVIAADYDRDFNLVYEDRAIPMEVRKGQKCTYSAVKD